MSMNKSERLAKEIVALCVGNADEPETEAVIAILEREYPQQEEAQNEKRSAVTI